METLRDTSALDEAIASQIAFTLELEIAFRLLMPELDVMRKTELAALGEIATQS